MTVRNTATISTVDSFLGTSTDVISSIPALNLNFLSGNLDPRITFTRSSGATYVGPDGYIKYASNNQPRFDYSTTSTGTCLGLLIEDQRTNIYRWSSSITTSTWSFSNTTARENSIQSPDGKFNASIISNTPNLNSNITPGRDSYNTSTFYTKSIYAKYITGSPLLYFQAILSDNSYAVSSYNIQSGVVNSESYGTSTGSTYISNAGNGWYRCIQTVQTLSTGSGIAGDSFFIGGYGSTALSTSFGLWGGQSEPGTFVSSLIPTGAASATRLGDNATIQEQNLLSFFNQSAGTVYAEYYQYYRGNSNIAYTPGIWGFTDPNSGVYNGYGVRLNPAQSGNGVIEYIGRQGLNGNASLWFLDNSPMGYLIENNVYKMASTWDSTTAAISINGNAVQTTTNTTPPVAPRMTRLMIGHQNVGGGPNQLGGAMRILQYWPTKLPNNQLTTVSSTTVFTGTSLANLLPRSVYTANTSNFVVSQGVIIKENLEVPDIDKYYVDTLTRPSEISSLNLNFLKGQLDSRITFNRFSGATCVGPDGYIKYIGNDVPRFDYSTTSTGTCLGLLIEEQRTNLHTYSSAFATNWTNNGNAIMARNSVVAPDGGLADVMTNTPNVGSYIYGNAVNLTSSTVYTRSMYGKGLGGNNLLIMEGYDSAAATNRTAYFDVSTGTVVYVGTGTGSIVNAGNGWWRCSWTFTSSTGTTDNSRVLYVGGYGTTPLTVPIAIWGSQLEQGTFATSYIPTVASQVTRSVDLATMSGQNFQSWYKQGQGTLYVEADSLTATADEANKFRWACSVSSGSGQKIGFYKIVSYNGLLPKITDDSYVSKFEPLLGFISTSTVFKAAMSYQTGNQFAAFNYSSTTTGSSTSAIPVMVDNLRIGNGDAAWCGHIRRIVYYPKSLSNSATQALTLL